MAPYYEGLCKDLKWQLDSDLLSKMKKANEEELKRLDDVLEDAEKNLGESEIRDAMMAKAEYLIRIGDKVNPPQWALETSERVDFLWHNILLMCESATCYIQHQLLVVAKFLEHDKNCGQIHFKLFATILMDGSRVRVSACAKSVSQY